MSLLQWIVAAGLAELVARGTLLLLVGWGVALVLRRAAAGARHLVWLSVIVGTLLIPLLARLAVVRVPLLPSRGVASPIVATNNATASRDAGALVEPTAGSTSAAAPASAWDSVSNATSLASGVWLVIAAVLGGSLLAGVVSIHRILRGSRPVESPDWERALRDAAQRLDLATVPRLVVSEEVEVAFTCNVLTPTIVLPESAGEWSDDRRRAVLLHELAHVRRRDLVGHAVANLACAVYWFHPLVWAAARRLRVESELACDDAVLDAGVRASDYAQHLLDMVTSLRPHQCAPAAALSIVRPKEFEGRLVAILDRAGRRPDAGRVPVPALLGVLGVLTMSIAAVVPVPRRAEVIAAPTATTVAPPASAPGAVPVRPTPAVVARRPAPKAIVDPDAPETVRALLRYGTAGIVNPMLVILRRADLLGLTATQADSIAMLNRWYRVRLDGIWSSIASRYVAHPESLDASLTSDRALRARRASVDLLIAAASNITGILTADQLAKLPPQTASYLDSERLTAIRSGAPAPLFATEADVSGGQRGGGRVGGPPR